MREQLLNRDRNQKPIAKWYRNRSIASGDHSSREYYKDLLIHSPCPRSSPHPCLRYQYALVVICLSEMIKIESTIKKLQPEMSQLIIRRLKNRATFMRSSLSFNDASREAKTCDRMHRITCTLNAQQQQPLLGTYSDLFTLRAEEIGETGKPSRVQLGINYGHGNGGCQFSMI